MWGILKLKGSSLLAGKAFRASTSDIFKLKGEIVVFVVFFFPTLLPTWAVRRLGAETPHPWDLPGSISLPRSCERGEAELIVLLALFPALRHQPSILQQKKKKK